MEPGADLVYIIWCPNKGNFTWGMLEVLRLSFISSTSLAVTLGVDMTVLEGLLTVY